jgi:hypothetical protein
MRRSLRLIVGLAFALVACGTKNEGGTGPGTTTDGGADGQGPDLIPADAAPCAQSPAYVDIPGNNCDDDGDGTVDNPPTCDVGLPETGDAYAFARAIDLCQRATGAEDERWGLISAEFKGAYATGTPPQHGQHGILPKFGNVVKPRFGGSLGVLSTGWAREYDDLNPALNEAPFKGGVPMQPDTAQDDVPAGFPKPSGQCDVDPSVTDVITLKLTIKAPANAQGIQLDFDFWSSEWPDYVCSSYNDAFIAVLHSTAFNGGKPDNISFDPQNKPVSVNNGFFDRCTPDTTTGCKSSSHITSKAPCSGGEDELAGTGFLNKDIYCEQETATGGGATGWLTSKAPITPGEVFTLELMIWDTGDQYFDSTVLLDHFQWLLGPTQTGTERPPR